MKDRIWPYFENYKVFTEDSAKRREILNWTGSKKDAFYFYPKSMGGGIHIDIIIDKRMIKRAEKFLGIKRDTD